MRPRPIRAVHPWTKNYIYDFIGSYYYTYKDGMEQEARCSVEVCQDVLKQ